MWLQSKGCRAQAHWRRTFCLAVSIINKGDEMGAYLKDMVKLLKDIRDLLSEMRDIMRERTDR